jgi:chemotaxis protein methyltransferase CheR
MRWKGFRKPRGQVCKRISARLAELGLEDLTAYRRYLEAHPREWEELAFACRVTISRWLRDREIWWRLGDRLLELASERDAASGLAAWSAGCASGEEPWTLRLLWDLELAGSAPGLSLRVLATDIDPALLLRAERACYPESSLEEIPGHWREQAFELSADGTPCLADRFRHGVTFRRWDVSDAPPAGPFDLVLCRNLVYTYLDASAQERATRRIVSVLREGGLLVVGAHEAAPEGVDPALEPLERAIYRRSPA